MDDLRVSFPKPCSESWDAMTPRGCNRHCAACDKIIHDLSEMTFDEIGTLIASDPEPCVRARVGRDGLVAIKSAGSSQRRLMAAFGALAAAGCQSLPGQYPPYGNIAGKVNNSCWAGTVVATSMDGRKYQGNVKRSRHYVVRYLPYGQYSLQYFDEGSEPVNGGIVTVAAGTVAAPTIEPEDDCIIVGQLRVEDRQG